MAIKPGSEITVNYGDYFGRQGVLKCRCKKDCKAKLTGNISAKDFKALIVNYQYAFRSLLRYKEFMEAKNVSCPDISNSTELAERMTELADRVEQIEIMESSVQGSVDVPPEPLYQPSCTASDLSRRKFMNGQVEALEKK